MSSPEKNTSFGLARRYRNLSVRTKILLPVAVAAAAALAIGALSLWSGAQAAQRAHDISAENVAGVSTVGDMREDLAGMRVAARDTVLAVSEADKHAADETLQLKYEAFETAATTYSETGIDAAQKAQLRELRTAVDSYLDTVHDVLGPLAARGDTAAWWKQNATTAKPLAEKMLEQLTALTTAEETAATRAAEHSTASFRNTRMVTLIVLGIGLTLSVAVGMANANATSRRIARVRAVAEALAEGDLTKRADLNSTDDVGTMGNALDLAAGNLRDLAVVPR